MVSTQEKIELLTEEFTNIACFDQRKIRGYLREIMVVVNEVSGENQKLRQEINKLKGRYVKCLKMKKQ